MVVRLNPAIRIIPPTVVTGDHWAADNLLERRRYRLSTPAVAALVLSGRPQEPAELAKRLMESAGPVHAADYWEHLIEMLRDRQLILDEAVISADPQLTWLIDLRRNWSRFGWHEAAEYHLLSFDYPCVDYSEALGVHADQSRMRGYQADEPDLDRFKTDYLALPEVPIPSPSGDMISGTARALWTTPPQAAPVGFASLSKVISLSFGATGYMTPRTSGAPALRRSSPSGGARHPTEGYLIALDVPDIEVGWYHVTMRPFGLRRLPRRPVDDNRLKWLFPQTFDRFPYPIKALVAITSTFERNMYRYREPRTFRTVHMDAGHIASSVRMVARSLGLTSGIYNSDMAIRIEETLGIDGMQEGYMLTVAIADGVKQQEQVS